MRVHFVIHEAYEDPGAYLAWAALHGHEIALTKVYQFDPLPQVDDFDWLIVMGGPQSPHSTKEEYPYYDAKVEIKLLQETIAADKPIIGVCLGAQLLGEAYGAPVEHSPEKEIGNFPIVLTQAGRKDPYLSHMGPELTTGHWHGDMPGLSQDAVVLATSQGCPRQIIRYAPHHYGFQAHLEFSTALVKELLAHEVDFDQNQVNHSYVQAADAILAYDYQVMNQALYQFLDQLSQAIIS